MARDEVILGALTDKVLALEARLEEATRMVQEQRQVFLQLHELSVRLGDEPEVQAARGPDFSALFVPAVGELIDRLRAFRMPGGNLDGYAEAMVEARRIAGLG